MADWGRGATPRLHLLARRLAPQAHEAGMPPPPCGAHSGGIDLTTSVSVTLDGTSLPIWM